MLLHESSKCTKDIFVMIVIWRTLKEKICALKAEVGHSKYEDLPLMALVELFLKYRLPGQFRYNS